MQIPFHQVDAFTDTPLKGNPAAVCLLDDWLPDATLQAIAIENNLSETAFIVRGTDAGRAHLRWFTPVSEVKLCGHATLASAAVVLSPGVDRIVFDTLSGPLTVRRAGLGYLMDFPASPGEVIDAPKGLAAALPGCPWTEVYQARDLIVRLPSAEAVRAVEPDFAAIVALGCYALIVTAEGSGADADVDFVSRFFAPGHGIPEDPVTGSAHCGLTPFWAQRLGKAHLKARQVSPRTGDLGCVYKGDRVELSGRAVKVIEGVLTL
jgi:predicted PhzF superfamily epimerase YddE/YHI9